MSAHGRHSLARDILADLRDAGMTDRHISRAVGFAATERQVGSWRRGDTAPYPYTLGILRDLHAHLTAWEPRQSVMPSVSP